MLKLFIDKQEADVRVFKFPAGELGVSFSTKDFINSQNIRAGITLNWESNEDIIALALLVDAVRRKYTGVELSLAIPYFPYARQDRVCNAGECLSLKVIADIINQMNFARVFVVDPHSEVLGAVVNNLIVPKTHLAVGSVIQSLPGQNCVALVSPDAGANKKVMGYAKELGGRTVIRADKTRNTNTGDITGTVVFSEHLGNTDLLVVDDIIDGGGTFIPLAAELRKITNGTVNLMASHGLFTKGVDIFEGVYDNIFVINNMYGPHPLIKEILS